MSTTIDEGGMKYETKITYTEGMVNTAVRKHWMRRHLGDMVMMVMVLGVASFFFFIAGFRHWFLVLLIAASLVYTGAVYGIFLGARARARAAFHAQASPDVAWGFTEDAISYESAAGNRELKWSEIKRLWRFKHVWLLVYANGAYSTLPVPPLSDALRDFIERKVAEAGGQVR